MMKMKLSKTVAKAKTETKTKTETGDIIYTRIKYEGKECNETFKSKKAPPTRSCIHNRNYLEDTED